MAHANRLYTVINFNLMKSSYFIPSKMEIWFSPVVCCPPCSPHRVFVALCRSSNHVALTPRRLLFMRWIVRLCCHCHTVNGPFYITIFICSNFPYNWTLNTHSRVHTLRPCDTARVTQIKCQITEKKIRTHWFKYDQMLVLKLCR